MFEKGAPPPCPSPFNLAAHVLGRAGDLRGKVALSVVAPGSATHWHYDRLEAAVRGVATGLLQAGLKPGDIVLMRLGNTVDFPVAYLGAITAGLVPVPTSSQLTIPEVTAILEDLRPAAILHGDGVTCPDAGVPVYDSATVTAWQELAPADYALGDPNRLAYIVYTSGTSGRSRAVGHAHRAIWARQMMMQGWYGLQQSDRLLHAGAFNWTYTLGTGLMDPWTMGATALIPAAGVSHGQIATLMGDHDVSIFAAAPGVYRNILRSGITPLPSLRHGLSAGEKLSQTLRDGWQQATGTPIFEAYGLSECSTFVSGSPDHPATGDALGRPQTGRQIAILGDDGPVPLGTPGTIAVHASDPGLMLGYVGAPEETAARFHGDWFLTGDQGIMDRSGQITYLGRSDDMMNAGGYRVSPIEVEAALLSHPGITEAGVAEVEIKEDVRLIAAFYTGPAPLSDKDLTAWCAQWLARYKAPRIFVHLGALPRNPNGKLLRRALPPLYQPKTAPA